METEASEAFAALPEPYKSADYNRGRRTFKLCQSCHTLNEGGQNLVGPNLYGVFGRQIGGVEGFTYSKAVQDSDIIWTPEILAEWLESPRNFLPGNKMSFAGVRKPDDRTAVIAYIMAETGYSGE
ncbi:MAG: cytochrome c family protein [Pseudomonadota bacterium]